MAERRKRAGRAGNEIALTVEEYWADDVGRTRPRTDGPMSNAGASRWRLEQAVAGPVGVVDRVLAARNREADT